MTELEHVKERLLVTETALRAVMATVMEMMPPHMAELINRIGWEWDKRIDAIDAQHVEKGQQNG